MKRVVPQLYAIDGVDYGGVAVTAHTDGHLYLLGNDGASGVKMAKVPWDSAPSTSEVRSMNLKPPQCMTLMIDLMSSINTSQVVQAGPPILLKQSPSSKLCGPLLSSQARFFGRRSTTPGL